MLPRCCAGAGATTWPAAAIGADVAFCLVGGRARVSGIGEVVEPLPFEPLELTLALPPFGCSTSAVYRAWDGSAAPPATGATTSSRPRWPSSPGGRVADRLGEATGQVPQLAGSGSTWFVEGAYPGPDRVVVRTVR